jgi:hypothetical protein
MQPNIERFRRGKTIGVNRDGLPVGHATRVNRRGEAEQWTAFVYIAEPPFDAVRVGFGSEDAVVEFIAKNGTPKS